MYEIQYYIPETNHFLGFRPITTIILSPVTGRVFLALLLSQPHTFQVSACRTFRVMCDVPTTAVFCIESSECFPGMVYKFLFKSFVTTPVAQITIGISIQFMFHIRCISIRKLLFWFLSCFLLLDTSCPLVRPRLLQCIYYLSLLLSSSSSPLCMVFILIFLTQTMSLGNTVLQLFCCYYSWCLYR